ncbi:hypothetical protein SNE40_006331 [Patella caerulea]|uniref:MRN complex-interacting protein N-terminal domain-containing protein n=1 Tax=Patella caerulea TaxID=87958 RepID=A0AAN8K7A2_PATCE
MPQEFHVLQCYKCQTFQVQQVKKVKKWACKMCGEKQSILRVYGHGSGADCRRHVQKLNGFRGKLDENKEHRVMTARSLEENDACANNFQIDEAEVSKIPVASKWSNYINTDVVETTNEINDLDNTDGLYTTDKSQFDQARKSYRKQKHENYKQYQYGRQQEQACRGDNYQDGESTNRKPCRETFKPSSKRKHYRETCTDTHSQTKTNIKTLPDNCLISKPAKRTKWDEFMTQEISEFDDEAFAPDTNFSEIQSQYIMDKYNRTSLTNKMALNDDSDIDTNFNQILSQNTVDKNHRKSLKNEMAMKKTMDIPNAMFDMVDYEEFLEEDIVTSDVKIRIEKSARTGPIKQSKWDFYTSPEVSDEEADYYPIHDRFHPLESDSKSLNYNYHAISKDCNIFEKPENCTSSNNVEPGPVVIQPKRDITPVFESQTVIVRSKRDITPVLHPRTDTKRDLTPVLHPQTDTKRDLTPVLHSWTDTKCDITPVLHPKTDTQRDITPVLHPRTDTKRDISHVLHPQTDTKRDITPVFQVDDFNDAEFEFLV